jgi:hypothetical protein
MKIVCGAKRKDSVREILALRLSHANPVWEDANDSADAESAFARRPNAVTS